MKRGYLLINILLGLAFLIISCAPKNLQKEFASFDKFYIPALSLTSQGKMEQSKVAMMLLKEKWKTFKGKYYNHIPKDSEWKQNFDDVEQMILEADEIVKNGEDLLGAHELLESVRFTFMELRKRNGIDYYVDYLTEFHEPMEEIVLTAKGKTPDTLTDADMSKIRELLAESSHLLDKIETARFDASLFGFSDEKAELMNEYVRLEFESLSKLRQSIENGDKNLIIKSAAGIKPNFVKLFLLFGDFESTK
jgi:hypothetical protein